MAANSKPAGNEPGGSRGEKRGSKAATPKAATPTQKPPAPPGGADAPPRGPGRPRGTTALTKPMEEEIIAYVAGGATAPAAAKAVGIHPRTLNDWRQRGEERHPTRAPSPRYRRFATRLRQAEGRSRILAEIELRHRDPRHYLARTARATEYDEGWADAPITRSQGGLPALASLTDEELDAALGRLTAALGELQGPSTAPPPSPAKRKGRR